MIYLLTGGLRAGMGYCGAPDIEKLHDAKFTRITNAGVMESHPHDAKIFCASPNYSRPDYQPVYRAFGRCRLFAVPPQITRINTELFNLQYQ